MTFSILLEDTAGFITLVLVQILLTRELSILILTREIFLENNEPVHLKTVQKRTSVSVKLFNLS